MIRPTAVACLLLALAPAAARSAALDRRALDGVGDGTAVTLDVAAPDGGRLALRFTAREERPGGAAWFGRLADDPASLAVAVEDHGRFAALVDTGARRVVLLPGTTQFTDITPEQAQRIDGVPHEVRAPSGTAPLSPASLSIVPSTIDLLVVYTPAAAALGDGIESQIRLAVEKANAAFYGSGIVHRLRLVHAQRVKYKESGDADIDLARLTDPSDGYLDEVAALRAQYGADLVSLWVAGRPKWEVCGTSNVMAEVGPAFADSAYTLVKRSCALDNTLVHEIGHNLGARHDWYVDDTDNAPFTFNHGYTVIEKFWYTLMAYPDECKANITDKKTQKCRQLPLFSSPEVTWGAEPLGVAAGWPKAADNVQAINLTGATVAAFRAPVEASCNLSVALDPARLGDSGRRLEADVHVANAGPGTAPRAKLQLFLSSDGTTREQLVHSRTLEPLAAGASVTLHLAQRNAGRLPHPHLIAVIDPLALIPETNKADNVAVEAVPWIDLAGTFDALSGTGGVLEATFSVGNLGNTPSAAFNVRVQRTAIGASRSRIVHTERIPRLEPGQSRTFSFSWSAKPVAPGDAITARIDPAGAVVEADTTNNTVARVLP